MSKKDRRSSVSDLLERIGHREIPTLPTQAERADWVRALDRYRCNRLFYVVDEQNRLKGALAVKDLVRFLLAQDHLPQVHGRRLLSLITGERAEELMIQHPLFCTPEEEVRALLRRMIDSNVKEVPVLDAQGKVIGELTLVDLVVYLET
ncbi:MAG: CBS domain-containing protein [bacterium]|nr:CBS domain-containing protein [bacterium]